MLLTRYFSHLIHLHASLMILILYILYHFLCPYTISGDGIKYVYIVKEYTLRSVFLSGHLLYAPSMAALARLSNASSPVEIANVMRACSQLAGASAVFLLFRTARLMGFKPFAQWMVAIGLAFSYGYWIQATDVETYALALFFVVASIYYFALYVQRGHCSALVGMGVSSGLASLFHLSTGSLAAAALFLIVYSKGHKKALGDVILFSGSFAAVSLVPIMVVGIGVMRKGSIGELSRWILSADHGDIVHHDLLTIPRAIYGCIGTYMYLGFFWEVSKLQLAVKFLVIVGMTCWLLLLAQYVRPRTTSRNSVFFRSMLVFVGLQALLGVYYFGSDTERWIFTAPVIWLLIWDVLDRASLESQYFAFTVVLSMAAVNFVQSFLPSALDESVEVKVKCLNSILPEKAHVITVGHDWLSYYNFYTSKRISKTTLIEIAKECREDKKRFFNHLREVVESALNERHEQVVVIRALDQNENERVDPWPFMKNLGISPASIREWLGRYEWDVRLLGDDEKTKTFWLKKNEDKPVDLLHLTSPG